MTLWRTNSLDSSNPLINRATFVIASRPYIVFLIITFVIYVAVILPKLNFVLALITFARLSRGRYGE
jgi:hypothetical protein